MNTRSQIAPATLFGGFAGGPLDSSDLRQRITRAYRLPEHEAVSVLLALVACSGAGGP